MRPGATRATRGASVVLARESLWLMTAQGDMHDRSAAHDRRGRLVLSAYAVYADVRDEREFEGMVSPLLSTMASSRSRSMLVLVEGPDSFDVGRVRRALQRARELGVVSMVEIGGAWSRALLELLAATEPSYVRLAPEMLQGVSAVPEVSRSLDALAEFARVRSLNLVARNPHDARELEAVRSTGIGLVQWAQLPSERARGAQRMQNAVCFV